MTKENIATMSESESIDSNPPQELQDRVLKANGSIQVLPQVALKAIEMVDDPDSSAQQLATLIQQDFKLATDILSIANSVIYSQTTPTASLHQAISRLGYVKCKNIIFSSSLAGSMQSMELEAQWIQESLTSHALLTGMISSNLNRELSAGFSGEEFAAGLVHDFGRLLLASTLGEEFSAVDNMEFDEVDFELESENSVIGSNHCEVGAWFLAEKGLPEALCDVARFHHSPMSSKQFTKLCVLTAVSDHMANHYQRCGDAVAYEPASNPVIGFLDQFGVQQANTVFDEIALDVLEKSVNDVNEMNMA